MKNELDKPNSRCAQIAPSFEIVTFNGKCKFYALCGLSISFNTLMQVMAFLHIRERSLFMGGCGGNRGEQKIQCQFPCNSPILEIDP